MFGVLFKGVRGVGIGKGFGVSSKKITGLLSLATTPTQQIKFLPCHTDKQVLNDADDANDAEDDTLTYLAATDDP